jgi:hypothetical protein
METEAAHECGFMCSTTFYVLLGLICAAIFLCSCYNHLEERGAFSKPAPNYSGQRVILVDLV